MERIIKGGGLDPQVFSLKDGANGPVAKEDKPDMEQLLKREYERGLAEGRNYAGELVKTQLAVLKQAVEEFSKAKHEAFKHAESQMVELSLKIAEAIIKREATVDRKIVTAIVKEALEALKDKSKISLFISPVDEQVIKEHLPKFMAGIEADIELITDESIEPGGCIVQTPSGRIDALLDTQIEEIRRRLL